MALANLLKVKVTGIYPMINGSETYSFKNLNQKIKLSFVDTDKPTITIMWTSTTPPPRNASTRQTGVGWKPNHFVPLVSSNQPVAKLIFRRSPMIVKTSAIRLKPNSHQRQPHTSVKVSQKGGSPDFTWCSTL